MNATIGFVLTLCAVSSMGCGQNNATPTTLDGEVFIVTEGAQSVKLGLVDVRVLPYVETKESIAKTKMQAEREVARLQPQLDGARKILASAEARDKVADAEYTAASKRADAAIANDKGYAFDDDGGDSVNRAVDSSISALDRSVEAGNAVSSPRSSLAALEKQARSWNSGALYFASLPPPLTSAKTDADGEFSLPIRRDTTVVLAANATRRVGNTTENYYWLITVTPEDSSKRIFLSNDNLATSDSKDSLIHVVE